MDVLYNLFNLYFREVTLKIQTIRATANDFIKDSASPKKKLDNKLICDFLYIIQNINR